MDFYIRNGKQINFKVGQPIQIRDWNEMAEEFDVKDKSGMTIIYCRSHFTSDMFHLCGAKAVITNISGMSINLEFDANVKGETDWFFSFDMIKPIK